MASSSSSTQSTPSPWSKIVRDDPEPPAVGANSEAAAAEAAKSAQLRDPDVRKAVIDANAIIKGFKLEHFDAMCVTIDEVIDEIRDKKGREALARALGTLTTCAPSEASVQAVKAFAMKTGDAAALSSVDVKLIALAYDLEQRNHGVEHLRTEPAALRTHAKRANRFEKQPGWDFVPNASDWAELDDMNAANEEAERLARASMASLRVSDDSKDASAVGEDESAAAKEARENREAERLAREVAAKEILAAQEHIVKDAVDDDAWESAVSRTTRVRRQKRESRKKEAEEEAARLAAEARDRGGEDVSVELEEAAKRAEDFFTSRGEIDDAASTAGDDDDEDDDCEVELESCVSSVTADFAMQNVILQMGMKLVTPDGMRIEHLRRWVLRCHACEEITRNLSRMFCPKCGNQTLQKVEHTVTRDGVEQFGVRKKFVLRGSKYTLPAPKGGRQAKKVILREDQLMGVRLTKKQVGDDVFAAEYNDDTYASEKHMTSQKTVYEIGGGDVRRNPNERRHMATNRRRK